MLHGSGRGRWHDKSVSLVVFPDGDAGLSFEHSWGDGQTLLRWANDISGGPGGDTVPHELAPSLASTRVEAEPLSVEVGPYVSAGIEVRGGRRGPGRPCQEPPVCAPSRPALAPRGSAPAASLRSWPPRLPWTRGVSAAWGSVSSRPAGCPRTPRCRSVRGVAPSARIALTVTWLPAAQVAYQRAYRRLFGAPASTYESCSTKHYRHGRTEAIRWARAPCHPRAAHGLTPAPAARARTRPKPLPRRRWTTPMPQTCSVRQWRPTWTSRGGASGARASTATCAPASLCSAHPVRSLTAGPLCPAPTRFALATTAAKHGRPHHELFSSAAYAKLKYDYMSTSNCSSELLKWFGFGCAQRESTPHPSPLTCQHHVTLRPLPATLYRAAEPGRPHRTAAASDT